MIESEAIRSRDNRSRAGKRGLHENSRNLCGKEDVNADSVFNGEYITV